MDIELIAIDDDIECQCRPTVRIVLVFWRIRIGTLELQTAPDVVVADGRRMLHATDLHAVFLLQLLDDG